MYIVVLPSFCLNKHTMPYNTTNLCVENFQSLDENIPNKPILTGHFCLLHSKPSAYRSFSALRLSMLSQGCLVYVSHASVFNCVVCMFFLSRADVASHIGSKSPTEAREHYDSNYICGNLGKGRMVHKYSQSNLSKQKCF